MYYLLHCCLGALWLCAMLLCTAQALSMFEVMLLMSLIDKMLSSIVIFLRVAWFSAIFRPFMNCVGQVGSLNALWGFKELPDTLWYCGFIELVLVLSIPVDHHEDVAC